MFGEQQVEKIERPGTTIRQDSSSPWTVGFYDRKGLGDQAGNLFVCASAEDYYRKLTKPEYKATYDPSLKAFMVLDAKGVSQPYARYQTVQAFDSSFQPYQATILVKGLFNEATSPGHELFLHLGYRNGLGINQIGQAVVFAFNPRPEYLPSGFVESVNEERYFEYRLTNLSEDELRTIPGFEELY